MLWDLRELKNWTLQLGNLPFVADVEERLESSWCPFASLDLEWQLSYLRQGWIADYYWDWPVLPVQHQAVYLAFHQYLVCYLE